MITRSDFAELDVGDEIILLGDELPDGKCINERWLVTKADPKRYFDGSQKPAGLHLEKGVEKDVVHVIFVAWNDHIFLGPLGIWSLHAGFHEGFNHPETTIKKLEEGKEV